VVLDGMAESFQFELRHDHSFHPDKDGLVDDDGDAYSRYRQPHSLHRQ
jgi:hypothetical protein